MIERLLHFSLHRRWLIVALSLGIMAVGYWCFRQLKIEAYPDIADANVVVIAVYPGRAAEEVEQQVTIPLERALQNTPKVLDRRSRTIFGLSVVQLTFEDGTDDYFARQQVLERLPSAELPEGVQPELAPLSTAVGEILRYVVEGPSHVSPMELRGLQDWIIRPALLQTKGIADIVTFGGPMKQFQVLVSPEQLRKYNLNLAQVEEAITRNNQNTGGNILERGGQGFAIRSLGALRNEEDLARIVVCHWEGSPIFLRDIASIEVNPPPASGILGYSLPDAGISQHSGVEGIALLRRYENPSEVLAELKENIENLSEQGLPEGVKIRILYDRSFLIDHSLHTVGKTLLEGISLVVIILILLLGSLRSALIVALTIPFSLLFAFILMRLVNIPANLLSLGAIDFGILVDGACVMVEHLLRRYQKASLQERNMGIEALTLVAGKEVIREIFFSVSIIILAYTPILLMTRVEGKLFGPMALTLAFAVIGSMVAALTLIPVLVSFAYHKALAEGLKEHENPVLKWLEKGYHRLITLVLNWPKSSLSLGFGCVLGLIGLGSQLGAEFLPELDEGSIFLRANFPAGISLRENAENAPKIREIISKYGAVSYVISQTGRNDDGTDPFPSNRNEILIGLKDYALWTDTLSKKALITQLQAELETAFPSVRFSAGQPIIDQVMEIVTGSAADLAVSIVGQDLELMRAKADTIALIMNQIEGSQAVNIEQEGPQDQLVFEIDRLAAARYGINVAEIQHLIEAAVGGKPITQIYEGVRNYEVILRYQAQYRQNLDQLQDLLVSSSNGALLPLRELCRIAYKPGQTNIYRYNNKRMVTVRTNIRGRDQGSFVRELQTKIKQTLTLPKGYELVYGGQYENLERAGVQLKLSIPLTIALVFILLFMLYGNLWHSLLTMTCILFALAGGIAALLWRGLYFNVSAGVGFVSIFGISVMAGVVLVSALNRAARNDLAPKYWIAATATSQLRAILSIMSLAILGLIPAAISTGIGSDVQRPLATVIIGGLTATLIFAPLLLPPLYALGYGSSPQGNSNTKIAP